MAGDSGKRKIVPHHKVRTGCETCKRRRVKCDEVRPACSNCSLVGRKCIYHHVLPSYPVFSPADYLDRSTIRFSTRDMELLHHWTSATAFTIGGTDDLRVMMRDKLPIEGFAKPYLLHLILAVSSLHLAYLKPNENTVYSTLARHHYSAALPLFRANLQFMDETNCHALYGSSQLLAKYALACEKRPQRLLLSPILDSSAQTDWLMLIRGAYSIRDSHSQILRRGPMSCTASDCWNGVSDNVESPYKENLERVTSLINGSVSENTNLDTYEEVLQILRHLFAHEANGDRTATTKAVFTAALARIPLDFFCSARPTQSRCCFHLRTLLYHS